MFEWPKKKYAPPRASAIMVRAIILKHVFVKGRRCCTCRIALSNLRTQMVYSNFLREFGSYPKPTATRSAFWLMRLRLFSRSVLCIALISLMSRAALPLDLSRKISQYGHNMWRIQDGYLPGVPVDIAQTKDGYLWIGTEAGLLRFDGMRFVAWVPPKGQQLPDFQILSLLSASDGSLWIGTAKGLARWKDGELTVYKDLPNRTNAIVEDHQGNIWIARSQMAQKRAPLCRLRDTDVHCFGPEEGVPLPAATRLVLDNSGNFWLSGHAGLCKWKDGVSTTYFQKELEQKGSLIGVFTLAVENENHAWIGIQQPDGHLELREFDHGRWQSHRLPKAQGPPPSASALFIDQQDALWIGTGSDGIYRMSGETIEHFSSADGLSSDAILRFFQDREGVLWVASSKGIDSFRDLPVVSFSIREGLVSDTVSTVLASHNGGVWIGGAEALGFIRENKLSAIRTKDGFPGRDITTMFEDHTGRLWIGVDSSLYVMDHGHFLPIRRPNGTQLGIIFGITEDSSGNEWVLTDVPALVRIDNLKVQQEIELDKIAYSIAADPTAGVWLGFGNGDLVRYFKDRLESFPADPAVSTSKIRTLIPESGDRLWAVTQDGLIWWTGNKRAILTTRNALPCNELYAAVKDTDGTLWLYSRCGLLSIAASESTLWQKDPSSQVKVAALDVYDGVQAGAVPLQPQASRSLDGRLWFANDSILQTFDPQTRRTNTLPPNVVMERIAANGANYAARDGIKLPPLIRNLEVDYTALSFVVPQKVRFLYKLEGHDNEWQDSQGRRQAFYSDLPPGPYRFRVTACNNSGVWNEAGTFLDFSVAPAYYQTTWFRLSCVAAFLVLLWAVYQLRLRRVTQRVQQRMQGRFEERERIARELHDTLLQSFQGVLLCFQGAVKLLSDRPDLARAKERMESAIEIAAQAIAEGRDAIQGLRSSAADTGDLAMALRALAGELASNESSQNPPAFELQVEGAPRDLDPILRDEVYRIAGEAMRNAFRHAHARRIEVEIHYDLRRLRLRVRDDGRGIDSKIVSEKGRPGHYGIRGMGERAKAIGGNLELWSNLDSGTEIELSIPAHAAYSTSPAQRRS